MFSRKSAATVATIATAVGSLVAFAPASPASAADVVTTTSFTHTCAVDGTFSDWTTAYNDTMVVSAPATVAPGEQFTIKMQAGSLVMPDANIGRLKYDFKVPTGVTVESAAIVPGTAVGLGGQTPTLFRVNSAGQVDAAGEYFRITGDGHLTINNGPNGKDNDPGKGLQVNKNVQWKTPQIAIVAKASMTEGTHIKTGIRTGDDTAAIKADSTSISFGDTRNVVDKTATYCVAAGDGRGALSDTEVVDPAVRTTVALDVPDNAGVGQEVALKANLDPSNAEGKVQFKDGSDDIGGPVTVHNGVAILDHTFTTRGDHDIKAVFTADAGFRDAVSAVKTVTVKTATTTTLTVPAAARVGEDVEFTANVSPDEATGTVQFKEGTTDLGAPEPVVNGKATITRKYDEAGSHTIKAVFNATGHFADSESDAKTVTVKDADFATTAVVIDPMDAVTGESTALRATVRPIPDGGEVEFFVDGASVGKADVGTGDGVAVLAHTFTTAGSASVTAKFLGAEGFAASAESAPRTVTVRNPDTRTDSSTALTVAGAPNVGKTATFTARVTPGTAGGKVQFRVGTTEVGTPVDVVNGVATLTYTFNAEGTFAITAEYLGDSNNRGSESGPTVVKVTTASTPVDPGGNGSLSNIFGS
ncbi:Ig-like domain-containing protein [Gordonia malaquae]|uniref:Ig-like domain-containing protein n=1 Tax=Gordonia TaxID=2053 RepID=UPI003019E0D2